MDTDALVINDENNVYTKARTNQARNLSVMLRENPELPDAMRDMASFFSGEMRNTLVKMAAVGEFLIKMTANRELHVMQAERMPMSDIYPVMKKYIPLNKRQSIDGIMGMMDNIKSKMKAKPASNGLESMINTLSRINELNKLKTSAGAVRQIASTLQENRMNGSAPTFDNLLDMVSSIVGEDRVKGALEKLM